MGLITNFTFRSLGLASLLAFFFGTTTLIQAARGHFDGGDLSAKHYPGHDWIPTKAFNQIYDWGFSGGPVIFGGFSSGGNNAYKNTCKSPSNNLCSTPTSWKHDGSCTAAKDIPVLTLTGQQDFGNYDIDQAQKGNASGAREAVVLGRGMGHAFQDPAIAYIFYRECIRLRYPPGTNSLKNTPRNEGWLGDMNSMDTDLPLIGHFSTYPGDKSKAAWLPTRYFAFCWRATIQGKGTGNASPITISKPAGNQTWENWSQFKEGDDIAIQAIAGKKGEDRMDICNGDQVIESFKANPFGFYSTTWKDAPAGIHGILAVSYKDGKPLFTSRMAAIIVSGNGKFDNIGNETQLSPDPHYNATSLDKYSFSPNILNTKSRGGVLYGFSAVNQTQSGGIGTQILFNSENALGQKLLLGKRGEILESTKQRPAQQSQF